MTAKVAPTWRSVFAVFDHFAVESSSACDTCAVKMKNVRPIKVVRRPARNESCI